MRNAVAIAVAVATIVAPAIGCVSSSGREIPDGRLDAAAKHLQEGRVAEAVTELRQVLEDEPANVQAGLTLASIYDGAGDLVGAIQVYRTLLSHRPSLAVAHQNLARLYLRTGELDRALQSFAAVGAIQDHAPAYLGMAEVHLRRGDHAAAERAIRQALRARPGDPEAHYALAHVLDDAGGARYAVEARRAWEAYIRSAQGVDEEKERLSEARERLRQIAVDLGSAEKEAILATAKRLLAPSFVPGAVSGRKASSKTSTDPGIEGDPLDRLFEGRVHISLFSADFPPIRGVGSGATLYEAVATAALDIKSMRLFDLYFRQSMERVRIAAAIEVTSPGPVDGFDPATEALELRIGERAAYVLPSDATARRLATFEGGLAQAASELGITPEGLRDAGAVATKARAIEIVAVSDGSTEPVDLARGLPAPSTSRGKNGSVARAAAIEALTGAALWLVRTQRSEGRFDEYDPLADVYLTETYPLDGHAASIVALLAAHEATGDVRFIASAELASRYLLNAIATYRDRPEGLAGLPLGAAAHALRALIRMGVGGEVGAGGAGDTGVLRRELASRIVLALGPDASVQGETAALEAAESALALGEELAANGDRSLEVPAARVAERLCAQEGRGPASQAVAVRVLATLSAATRAERYAELVRGVRGDAGEGGPDPAARIGEIVARSSVPSADEKTDKALAERALKDAILDLLPLRFDEVAVYWVRDRGRTVGGFRSSDFDPTVRLLPNARAIEALALALELLPTTAAAAATPVE